SVFQKSKRIGPGLKAFHTRRVVRGPKGPRFHRRLLQSVFETHSNQPRSSSDRILFLRSIFRSATLRACPPRGDIEAATLARKRSPSFGGSSPSRRESAGGRCRRNCVRPGSGNRPMARRATWSAAVFY